MRGSIAACFLALVSMGIVHCAADGSPSLDDRTPEARPDDAGSPPDAADGPLDGGSSTPDASICSADGWCSTSLPSTDITFTAVWSFSTGDALAASTNALYHWDGTTWAVVDDATAEGLTDLWARSPTDVWGIAKARNRLVHGTRASASEAFAWSAVEHDQALPSLNVIRGSTTGELWALGNDPYDGLLALQRGVVGTAPGTDGGTRSTVSWTVIPVAVPYLTTAQSFAVTPGDEVWVAGSTNEGGTPLATIVHGTPDTPGGTRYDWAIMVRRQLGVYSEMNMIWGDTIEALVGIGNSRMSFLQRRSNDGALAWSHAALDVRMVMKGLWGSGPDDVWAVGEAGAVRHWDGSRWAPARLAVDDLPMWKNLAAVHGGPDGDVWIVGAGVALHRDPKATGETP